MSTPHSLALSQARGHISVPSLRRLDGIRHQRLALALAQHFLEIDHHRHTID